MEGFRQITRLKLIIVFVALAAQACGGVIQTRVAFDTQACVEHALRRGGDQATLPMARDTFRADCEAGDAAACSQLGVMYEKGLGVEQSTERARDLYSGACDEANTAGCVNYGMLLADGQSLARSDSGSRLRPMDHAVRLFATACRQGDARGCGELGRVYLVRMGDVARSVPMLRQACDGGQGASCFLLGSQYDHGALGDDPLAAMSLYKKACATGDEKGCLHLDLIYAKISTRPSIRVAVPARAECPSGKPCAGRLAQRRVGKKSWRN